MSEENEILRYAIEHGIIDINTIQQSCEVMKKQEFLDKHNMNIWQGKNGKWYTYLPDHKKGRRLIARNTRSALDDVIIEYYRDEARSPMFEDAFSQWVGEKLRYGEIQKQTYDRYINDYNKYIKGSDIDIRCDEISERLLEVFIKDTIHKFELTNKSWSNLRTLLIGTFRYAKKHDYTTLSITNFLGDLDLSRKIFAHNYKDETEEVFTDEEVNAIWDYVFQRSRPSMTDFAILLSFETGLRAGELASLKYSDIDMENRCISISRTEVHYKDENGKKVYDIRESPKTEAGFRKVYFNQETEVLLKRVKLMNPFGEFLFMNEGKRCNGNSFTLRLYRICNKLKIKHKSLHKCRKTYATKLINASVSEAFIVKQMGHKDISTTRSYYYFDNQTDAERREAIQASLTYKVNQKKESVKCAIPHK